MKMIVVRITMNAFPEKQKEVLQTLLALIEPLRSGRFSVLLGTKSLLCAPMEIQIFTISDSEGIEAVNSVRKKQIDFSHIDAGRRLRI